MKDLYKLISTPEDEYHDFKVQWYSPTDRAEMVRDIFSFINTTHHEDCYLIFGVDDNGEIVGVENDENRLNTQKITDFLHAIPIANSRIPRVIIESIHLNNHVIDIMIIKDTVDVPVYLSKDKNFKGSKRPIHGGQIFVRENDTNTPKNESASDYLVERLWKKRFGLDLSIKERYIFKLNDVENWEYIENGNETFFLYDIDPDYAMFLEDDDIERNKVESYSLNQIRPRLYWQKLLLKFRNRIVAEFLVILLDGARFMSLAPNLGAIPLVTPDLLTFQYFIADSLEFAVENLFLSLKHNAIGPDQFQQSNLFKRIVIFKNKTERDRVQSVLTSKKKIIKEKCFPSQDEIDHYHGLLSVDFKDKELNSINLKNICQEAKVSEYIINYLDERRHNL